MGFGGLFSKAFGGLFSKAFGRLFSKAFGRLFSKALLKSPLEKLSEKLNKIHMFTISDPFG